MPHWYLASWAWNGEAWTPPANATAAIDLRPLSAQATAGGLPSGWGFFGFDTTQTLAGSDYFGDDLAGNLNLARRNAWRTKLQIATALDNTRLLDVLAETLGQKSDPTLSVRAKPLLPTREGNLEIWLAGSRAMQREFGGSADVIWPRIQMVEQDDYRAVRNRCLLLAQAIEQASEGDGSLAARIVSAFAIRHGATFAAAQTTLAERARRKFKQYLGALVLKYKRWNLARTQFIPNDLPDEGDDLPDSTLLDNFNRNDSSSPGSSSEGWSWGEVVGSYGISSNRLTRDDATTNGAARAESDLSSADHYAQVLQVNASNSSQYCGPCIRFHASDTTYYLGFCRNGSTPGIYKRVTGTLTNIMAPSGAVDASAGLTVKVDASGSTLELFKNGASLGTITDTAITGNTRTGVGIRTSGELADDFEASDGLAGGTTVARLLGGLVNGGTLIGGRLVH